MMYRDQFYLLKKLHKVINIHFSMSVIIQILSQHCPLAAVAVLSARQLASQVSGMVSVLASAS